MGTQYFLSTPRSWQDEKKGFFFLGKTSSSQVVLDDVQGLTMVCCQVFLKNNPNTFIDPVVFRPET